MLNNKKILIIIPAYNEKKNIVKVILDVKKHLPEAHLLVVDDNSSDDTRAIALQEGAVVLSHKLNLGDGAARQTGFFYAVRKKYDIIIQMDGDGQHKAESISNLLEPLKDDEADIVIGSRFLSKNYKPILARYIGMKFFSFVIRVITGLKITDPTSGFRAMNAKVCSLYTTDIYPQSYPDADVIIATYYNKFRITEVPVKMEANYAQSIHSGLKPCYYIYKMVLSILMVVWRKK